MKKNMDKMIMLGFFVLITFLISIILFFNDALNYFLVLITITVVLFSYLCVVVFRKNDSVSVYERELKKILKTYDSILVYSEDDYKIEDEQIIFVKSLNDLIKSSRELNKPIIYVNEEKSCLFIVKEENSLLVYIMKENDGVISKLELKLLKHISQYKNTGDGKTNILDNIDKTTLIQLKNNKVYKVSPVKKKD